MVWISLHNNDLLAGITKSFSPGVMLHLRQPHQTALTLFRRVRGEDCLCGSQTAVSCLLAFIVLLIMAPFAVWAGVEDPPEIKLGERLFVETRFAQFYFAQAQGNANYQLPAGDPVMNATITTGLPLPGPFAGQSMNCRACHLVDEFSGSSGNRTYDDFGQRSPIPARDDSLTVTPRNSPPLVSAARSVNGHVLLHLDGQFSTMLELVEETLTGRNYGWMPRERSTAIHHLANIIRNDDGTGTLAQERSAGLSYKLLFQSTSPLVWDRLRLPAKYRMNVAKASDQAIFVSVSRLIAVYVSSLEFGTDANGEFDGSPYDVFLAKNGLPKAPKRLRPGLMETDLAYSQRLRGLLDNLANPQWVTGNDGQFGTHDQAFQFGPDELAGLKIFLAEPPAVSGTPPSGGVGNCLRCHMAPSFSDFRFHNTGVEQEEYDSVHGQGSFVALSIPTLAERRKNYNAYLPATTRHPDALGVFRSVPNAADPGQVDLGVWNILSNPDIPAPQPRLRQLLLVPHANNTAAAMLERAIARFKTPSLRDLGHSDPYLHTGTKNAIEDVIQFYIESSDLVRQGQERNPDSEMGSVFLDGSDVAPLAAFLRSLNEDYTD